MSKMHSTKKIQHHTRGFVLVEMLVAVFLFSIVMFVSLGAVLTLVDANRKNQSIKSVVNNLTLVVNGMAKNIAVGSGYYCGEANNSYNGAGLDCDFDDPSSSAITFTFNEDSNNNGQMDVYRYKLQALNDDGSGQIVRSIDSVNSSQYIPITAPEVNITKLRFLVYGTDKLIVPISGGAPTGDIKQPKVVVYIEGYAGEKQTLESSFRIQTTVSQRTLDVVYQ